MTTIEFLDKLVFVNRNVYDFSKKEPTCQGGTHMSEKNDRSSALRRLKSPNHKTRQRAQKILKQVSRKTN